MKALLISPTDIKGGASKVAFELASGLVKKGYEVDLYVNDKLSNESFVKEFSDYETKKSQFKGKVLHRLGINQLNLNSAFPKCLGQGFFEKYDLIHLHDLPRGFNYSHFTWLSKIRPVLWTIHSMAPFTGNCIFSYDCDRWQNSCGSCPQFGQWPLKWFHRDGSSLVLKLKKRFMNKAKVRFIGVSKWTQDQLSESIYSKHQIDHVSNPIDLSCFYKEDKKAVRKRLGIPENSKVVMFALGGNPEDKRKGTEIILKSLKELQGENLFLLPTGIAGMTEEYKNLIAQFKGLTPTYLKTTDNLRAYYNAADFVWHPSLADTSSMVSLEAFACGTPVIAAKVGGVPEIVRDEINGLLINSGSVNDLVNSTRRLLSSESLLDELSRGALTTAKGFSKEKFMQGYIKIYNEVLKL